MEELVFFKANFEGPVINSDLASLAVQGAFYAAALLIFQALLKFKEKHMDKLTPSK